VRAVHAAGSLAEVRAFAERVGYPILVKPRDGAGASGAARVDSDAELEAAAAALHLQRAGRSPSRSSSRATRASSTR
jgi:biotin carboxylase